MRKIILYILGGILVFFGVFSFVMTFLDLSGEPVDPSERAVAIVMAAIGVLIIVVNRIVKPSGKSVLKTIDGKVCGLMDSMAIKQYKKGRCPHCGAAMEFKGVDKYTDADMYSCSKHDLSYRVKKDGRFTAETDENGKTVLASHVVFPYTWWYERKKDSDGDTFGTILPDESARLRRVFKFLEDEIQSVYDENSPEFKQAVEDAEKLDRGYCPICGHAIYNREVFVKGHAGHTSKEYNLEWIPSMGGSVFVEREVTKGATLDHYETETGCQTMCHTKPENRTRITRALAFRKKENEKVDKMLSKAYYRFEIKPKEENKQ